MHSGVSDFFIVKIEKSTSDNSEPPDKKCRRMFCPFYWVFIGHRDMKNGSRQLILNKGSEKYIFRYEDGCEGELLDAIVDNASDRGTDFDWFDAAVLSFKLTQSLIGEADELLHKDMPDAMQSFNAEFE